MARATTSRRLGALAILLMLGLPVAPALAEDAGDPLAALPVVGQAELADLSGRQGISISDQDLVALAKDNEFEAGRDIDTGHIDFGGMRGMNGFNNQAVNTGNAANVQAGMAVHLHLH